MQIPENGFYYHYKHNPQGEYNNYAYEVLGIARHSEDKSLLVMYRPLYKNTYLNEALCSVRPLTMFIENVTVNSEIVPRFSKINDSEIISRLKKEKGALYPSA